MDTVSGQYKFFKAKTDDGSYRKYTLDTQNNFWLVSDKSGMSYTFGISTSTRQDSPDGTKVFKWMLERMQDSNGNFVKYEYHKNLGIIFPSKILYTGHGQDFWTSQITINGDPNPRPETSFKTGFQVTSNFRVKEIIVQAHDTSRSYILNYATGDNGARNILASIEETTLGYPPSTQIILPPTTFESNTTDPYWRRQQWDFPETFVSCWFCDDNGSRLVDVNGDGLADIIRYSQTNIASKNTYINNGNGGFDANSNWLSPVPFSFNGRDSGARLIDVNGDGLVDITYTREGITPKTYLNTGNGWQQTSEWGVPDMVFDGGVSKLWKFGDLNGDGLVDIFRQIHIGFPGTSTEVVINNGVNGWYGTNQFPLPPVLFNGPNGIQDNGVRAIDVNGDSLVDIVHARDGVPAKTYINAGNGAWIDDPAWVSPLSFVTNAYYEYPIQLLDMNGDGLVDILCSAETWNAAYINNGNGWTLDQSWVGVGPFTSSGADNGSRAGDINGDGLDDIARSTATVKEVYFNQNTGRRGDTLSKVNLSTGGDISVTYKPSTHYVENLQNLNSSLPFVLDTVSSININNGLGTVASTSYEYKGGDYYFLNGHDRKFSGFNIIETRDAAGTVTKNFYHQGNGIATSSGEIDDHVSKIGRVYKTEVRDQNNNLYVKEINKWSTVDRGNSAAFVNLSQKLSFAYDGDSDHREKAESFIYDTDKGNISQKTEWGEVTGGDTGSFVDIGNDKFVTDFAYATSSTSDYISVPSNMIVSNQTGSKVKEIRYYYDNLALGAVDKGNITKQEQWKGESDYISTQKTYDARGLILTETDPRGKTTTYTYDTFGLYPATSTNPLGHVKTFEFNYLNGKPERVTDSNEYVFETVFDQIGRPTEEKRSSDENPSVSIIKTAYQYTDTGMPRLVRKIDYLTSTSSVDTYTYVDGLGRIIQTRTEIVEPNTFAASYIVYNSLSKIQKESLPYYSVGSAYTTPIGVPTLYTTYTYDPLLRIKTIANAMGTTVNNYDDWKLTTTDAAGKIKTLFKDAHENLVRVDEHNGSEIYTTQYEWDGNKNLTKITDAAGNVRNFTYDKLGRLLSSEDLHVPGDIAFGVWDYAHDDAGNVTSVIEPRGNNILYSYDDINRRITEDNKNDQGVEVVYGYDVCVGGVGKLCYATTSTAVVKNEWYPSGNLKKETKNIFGMNYVTQYSYDFQDNPLTIIHPDNSTIHYVYDGTGLLDTVSWSGSGVSNQNLININSYSPVRQVTNTIYANGVQTTNSYAHTKQYRLVDRQTQKGGVMIQDLSYTYDPVGNIIKIIDDSDTNAAKTINYTYDDLHRLSSASTTGAVHGNYTETYTYSNIGNITNKSDMGSYLYAGSHGTKNFANPHAVTMVGSTTLSYDSAGNLLSDGIRTNTWDYANRLIKVVVGTTTTTYTYDAEGNRLTSKTGALATTTVVNRTFEVTGATSTKRVYVGNDLAVTIEGAGTSTPRFVHLDHLSGSNVITNMNGSIEELTDYYPYGKINLDQTISSFKEKKKFAGTEYDNETDLNYMKSRYQNPATGQFLSQDPALLNIGNSQGFKESYGIETEKYLSDPQLLNSYSYARNNPLNLTDKSGEIIDTLLDIGFIGYDIYNLGKTYSSGESTTKHWTSLGLDIGGALIPGVTGLGHLDDISRGIRAIDQSVDSTKVAKGLKLGESFGKFGTVVETTPGELKSFTNIFTKDPYHGLNQAITREISPHLINDTVKNPLVKLKQGNNSVYLTKQAAVVLDKSGGLITTYKQNEFKSHVSNILKKIK